MNQETNTLTILMADDDPDDRFLVREAFSEIRQANPLAFVKDGQELMDYLFRRGQYRQPGLAPRPALILLDLNMPRMDGREALQQIKADGDLRRIPVVALTTSQAEEDILRTYDLGVAGYVVKPVSFNGLVDVIQSLTQYWFEIVKLPADG